MLVRAYMHTSIQTDRLYTGTNTRIRKRARARTNDRAGSRYSYTRTHIHLFVFSCMVLTDKYGAFRFL